MFRWRDGISTHIYMVDWFLEVVSWKTGSVGKKGFESMFVDNDNVCCFHHHMSISTKPQERWVRVLVKVFARPWYRWNIAGVPIAYTETMSRVCGSYFNLQHLLHWENSDVFCSLLLGNFKHSDTHECCHPYFIMNL